MYAHRKVVTSFDTHFLPQNPTDCAGQRSSLSSPVREMLGSHYSLSGWARGLLSVPTSAP